MIAFLVLAAALDAGAAPPPPPPAPAGGLVLLAAGATWEVSDVVAPKVTKQLAAVTLAGLDVAAGRRKSGESITGDAALAVAPTAWPLGNSNDATAMTAPLAPAPPSDDQRIAVLRATTRFTVSASAADLRVLDVAVRYGDGVIVWLNGLEVARRRIGKTDRANALATGVRGPEWETFHIPVVPGLLRVGDNIVAVEVRPSARAAAPHLDVAIVGRPAASSVRGPVLSAVTRDSATIDIDTDLPIDAAVEWGATDALGTHIDSPAGIARHHAIALTGLPTSATVYYRVLVGGSATPVRTFRTLPGPGTVLRIAAYGDARGGHDIHQSIVDRIRAWDPDFVLATGDLVLRGTDDGDWQRFFAITGEMLATIPFWSATGNHDAGRSGDAHRRFVDLLAVPTAPGPRPDWASWYSVDVGDVHVSFLDSNGYDEPTQLDWLDADLTAARARGAKVLLAVTHDGPYSRGEHGGNATCADKYVPVLVKHGVTLLLAGHDHIYQRGRAGGLDYIVTGGGGADLYEITCGVDGKHACKKDDGAAIALSEHHYVQLTVYPDFVEVCPFRPDGSPLEPCSKIKVASGPGHT